VPITGGRLDDDEFALHLVAEGGSVSGCCLVRFCHTRNPAHRPRLLSLLQHLDIVILPTTSAYVYADDCISSR
jgi:hypothetical protein